MTPLPKTIICSVLLLCMLLPVSCWAGMKAMSDGELSAVTAQGFSRFTMVNGVALADFSGISASTYTEIDSLKLGYWDKAGSGTKGWDQNWTSVKLGNSSNDLTLNGFFFKAEFDPVTINDPASRQLKGIVIGSRDVTGTVSADFRSFTGITGGSDVSRSALGQKTYQFNHSELSFSLELTGPRKGVWVNLGTATQI